MKTIITIIISLVLCFCSYFMGYYNGNKTKYEQLVYEKKTAIDSLNSTIIKLKKRQYVKDQYYETRINAIYGSSNYRKFEVLLRSMDNID